MRDPVLEYYRINIPLSQRVWGWTAAIAMIAMVVLIFPPPRLWQLREKTVHVQAHEEISIEAAEVEAQAILDEAKQLAAQNRYTAEKYVEHTGRLTHLGKYSRDRWGHGFGQNLNLGLNGPYLGGIYAAMSNQANGERWRIADIARDDPELKQLESFRPETSRWNITSAHAWAFVGHFAYRYPLTMILAIFYHLTRLAYRRRNRSPWEREEDCNLWAELLGGRLLKASALWPVYLWYQAREPREQMRKAVRRLSYALCGSLALFAPAAAQGQTQTSKGDPTKKKDPVSLQVDVRNSSFLGEGPPDPNLFLRVTASTPQGVLETISTYSPKVDRWSNEFGGGLAIVNRPGLRVNGVGYFGQSSAGSEFAAVGTQIFWVHNQVAIPVPVFRFERELGGDGAALAFGTNPSIRFAREGPLARLAVTTDVSLRKELGEDTPLFWRAGAGLRFIQSPQYSFEVGVLRDSNELTQIRARMVTNVLPRPPASSHERCKTDLFVRVSTGSNLAFATWPCSRVFPAAGVSYNPDTDYYEALAGVGATIAQRDRTRSLSLFLTYAHAREGEYLEGFIGPGFTAGGLQGGAFGVYYIPLEEESVWQVGLDHARLSYDLGPVSPGLGYTNWYSEGEFSQRLGPTLGVDVPKVGPVQFDALFNLDNADNQFRVGYGHKF